jgi:HK97 family phage portal protein
MNPFAALLGGHAERKVADASALTWSSLFGAPASKTGVAVNIDNALRVSTVLACCRVLAEDIAGLPLKLYEDLPDGQKRVASTHPLHRVLFRQPNPWMTAFEWRETAMYHALLAKGAFAVKNVVGGKVYELYPLRPETVTVRQARNFDITYVVNDGRGEPMTFTQREMFHLRGPSWNGVTGLEMVQQAREAIGLGIAIEESQARLHSNGVRPGGLVSAEGTLKPETANRLREQIESIHKGIENVGKILVVDNSARFTPFAMSGVDAQTLESRKHQIEEIARMFRVFPLAIGYSDKSSTYASTEAFLQAHVTFSLRPWIERWEQAIWRDLINDDTRLDLYAKHSVQALLRGDHASRAEFYKAGLGTSSSPGWLTPNDVRQFEDMDQSDDPGADELVTVAKLSGGTKPQGAVDKPAPPGMPDPADEDPEGHTP